MLRPLRQHNYLTTTRDSGVRKNNNIVMTVFQCSTKD